MHNTLSNKLDIVLFSIPRAGRQLPRTPELNQRGNDRSVYCRSSADGGIGCTSLPMAMMCPGPLHRSMPTSHWWRPVREDPPAPWHCISLQTLPGTKQTTINVEWKKISFIANSNGASGPTTAMAFYFFTRHYGRLFVLLSSYLPTMIRWCWNCHGFSCSPGRVSAAISFGWAQNKAI